MIQRVMLSAKFDPDPDVAQRQMELIRFPVLASPKIDGIRAHIYDGKVLSRKNKLIPNRHVQKMFGKLPNCLDGELTCGLPTSPSCFNTTQSAVMSQDGEPQVHYHCFDMADETRTNSFTVRQIIIQCWYEQYKYKELVSIVEQVLINNLNELLDYETLRLGEGWEGIMIRDPNGPYKQGRSTLREGYLIKLKRFLDSEAEILGVYEQETNTNEAKVNEVGLNKRSSHKANKVANGHLGGFFVKDLKTGVEFDIGTFLGITKEQRLQMWLCNPQSYIGKIVKYKFLPIGVKDRPRHPILLGFRSSIDM